MIPSKPETLAHTLGARSESHPEKDKQDKNNEDKLPRVSSRQNLAQEKISPGEANSILKAVQPEIVTRKTGENPEKVLIADGVWLRHKRKISQLINEIKMTSSSIDHNNQDELINNSDEIIFLEFGKTCFQYIKYLEFESDLKQFNFIISLAKTDPWRCAMNFDQSFITDQEYIFQIAMACAEHKNFCYHANNFNLNSETDRIKLAKKCCAVNPKNFIDNIKKFSIKNNVENFNIASNLAKLFPGELSKVINEFNIEDENDRKKIAFLCDREALENLYKFKLSGESRTQLAMQIMNTPNGHHAICTWIKALEIPKEDDRAMLAEQCALQDGIMLAENILDFAITDENLRFRLAKKCLKYIIENQHKSFHKLANFDLTDSEKYKAIVGIFLKNLESDNDWNFLFKFIKKCVGEEKSVSELIDAYLAYKSLDSDLLFEDGAINLIEELVSERKNPSYFEDLFLVNDEDLEGLLNDESDLLFNIFQTPLINLISGNKNNYDEEIADDKENNLKWVRAILFYIDNLKIDNSTLTDTISPALKDIAKINDKKYRDFLTHNIFSLSLKLPPKSEVKKFTSANRLPLLLSWSISTPEMQKFLKEIPRDIIHDGNRQRKLIEAVCSLRNSGLLADEIKYILSKILSEIKFNDERIENPDERALTQRELKLKKINNPSREKNLENLKEIVTFLSKIRVAASFDEEDLAIRINNSKDLDEILKKIVITNLSVDEKDYEEFSSVFYNYRDSMSLLIYLSRIRNLTAASHLTEFVNLVLNDQFLPARYARSEVLALCEKNLQDAWKLNVAVPHPKGGNYFFTDDHEIFINMGIRGSCQRVDGDPSLNRGVIGAAMDGSEKLCGLKNPSGDILQRCIVRLMWAQPANTHKNLSLQGKPCIFIENIYPPTLNADSKINLINFAYGQAKRLNLPVALTESGTTPAYPNLGSHYQLTECASALLSGEIQVPLYSDAKNGIQERAFSIDQRGFNALFWITPRRQPESH